MTLNELILCHVGLQAEEAGEDVTEAIKRRMDLAKVKGGKWITIRGAHVFVDGKGKMVAGPKALKKRR